VLSRNPTGGQSSARVEPHYLSPAVAVVLASTYRFRPKVGFGIEGFAAFELRAASNEWLDAVGLSFGHRSVYGLSLIAEGDLQMQDFGPRRGWFLRGGFGAHWIDDNLRREPNVLEVSRVTRGAQMFGEYGYRWPLPAGTSLTLQAITMLQTTGFLFGLSVGGGLQ
jgi:hypothetical protein